MENNKIKSFKIKVLEGEERYFTGYLSVYGNIDRDGDVFEKGAFKKSIENKNMVPLLYQHKYSELIGSLELIEDEKGVYAKAKLFEKELSPRAEQVYLLLKEGVLDSMSVGFGIESKEDLEKIKTGYKFKKAYVKEGSVVMNPSNLEAKIDNIKHFDNEKKELNRQEIIENYRKYI